MDRAAHRRDRFRVLSARRQAQAVDLLRLIGNLSSSNYEWDRKEVVAMFNAIRKAVAQAEQRFHDRMPSE